MNANATYLQKMNEHFALGTKIISDGFEAMKQRERVALCALCDGSGVIEKTHSYVGGNNMPPGHIEIESTGVYEDCPECNPDDHE